MSGTDSDRGQARVHLRDAKRLGIERLSQPCQQLALVVSHPAGKRVQQLCIAGRTATVFGRTRTSAGEAARVMCGRTGVDQNKVVNVCEAKMSLRGFAVAQELEALVNSRICPPRIKVVTERGAAKTGVNCRAACSGAATSSGPYASNRIALFSMAAWLPYCQVMLRCSCPIGRPE